MILATLNKLFEYKADSGDKWRILKQDSDGLMRGDCEDYALSVLYYVVADKSLLKFWWLLLTKAKIHYVKNGGEGHAVLQYDGKYIDNWTKEWVSKQEMEALGHKFHWCFYLTYQVVLKMLYGKLRGL